MEQDVYIKATRLQKEIDNCQKFRDRLFDATLKVKLDECELNINDVPLFSGTSTINSINGSTELKKDIVNAILHIVDEKLTSLEKEFEEL